MSINLTNLKLGRQTVIEGTEHTVTKVAGGYELAVGRRNWKIAYDKAAKVWTVASRGEEYTVRNATAETVLDRALELVAPQPEEPEVEPAPAEEPEVDFNQLLQEAVDEADLPEEEPAYDEEPEPAPEEAPEEPVEAPAAPEVTDERRAELEAKVQALLAKAADKACTPEEAELYLAKAGALMDKYAITQEDLRRRETGDTAEDVEEEPGLVEIGLVVDTKGGFGPYRTLSMLTIARAFGVDGYWTQAKGDRYHGRLVLHLVGQQGILTHLRAYLPAVVAQAELLAKPVSRAASREWRLAGKHHSAGGWFAKADFMRGFAQGVASMIATSRQEVLDDLPESAAIVVRDWKDQVAAHMAALASTIKLKDFPINDADKWREGFEAGTRSATPAVEEGGKPASTELVLA